VKEGTHNTQRHTQKYDVVLFDLDGVLTATAKVHAACWKKMFDEYVQKRAAKEGTPFQPFEIATRPIAKKKAT